MFEFLSFKVAFKFSNVPVEGKAWDGGKLPSLGEPASGPPPRRVNPVGGGWAKAGEGGGEGCLEQKRVFC